MNFFCIFAAVGLLALAGLCGVALGWIEKKALEEDAEHDTWRGGS